MNPAYRLFIDVCLNKAVESEAIWMRLITTLQFAPRNGDNIKLTDDSTGDTKLVELAGVHYDMSEGYFVAELADDTMAENYKNGEAIGEADLIAEYKQFGFVRLNFPQMEGRT
jgi:hypothetical protein